MSESKRRRGIIEKFWHWVKRTATVLSIAFWNDTMIIVSLRMENITRKQRLQVFGASRQLLRSIVAKMTDYIFIGESGRPEKMPRGCTTFCLEQVVINGQPIFCEAPKRHTGLHRAGLPISDNNKDGVIRLQWPIKIEGDN